MWDGVLTVVLRTDCVTLVVAVALELTGVVGYAVADGINVYEPFEAVIVGLMSTNNTDVALACTLTPPVIVDCTMPLGTFAV